MPNHDPNASARPSERGARTLLIVNRHSRSGKEQGDEAEAALDAAGLTVVRGHARSRDDVSRLIRRSAGEVGRVVVGGGDGSLHAAAPGVIATGLPLGILPLGTANDLARTLGLPLGLDAAARVIADGRTRSIDLGEVNGHPFFNVASLGFGVDLTRALTSDAKRRWGPLGSCDGCGHSMPRSRSRVSATYPARCISRSATGGTTVAA